MAGPHEHEFLSLETHLYPPNDDSRSSPFDTLWTEFASNRPRLSPPRSPMRPPPPAPPLPGSETPASRSERTIELRALDYVSDYDSNLMCPICHIPLIEPVVLDCDHTFCRDCFEEYRHGGPSTDRSRCPTCRSYHLGASRKASRLIKNMCNDIQVRCPNRDCSAVMARGCVEQHATKECAEEMIPCADPKCTKQTKRKNFLQDQCIHNTHVECDCGASIQLGRSGWLKHKDKECPKIPGNSTAQDHDMTTSEPQCPGADFGCTDEVNPSDLEPHIESCPLARLAPHMKKQCLLLKSLQEQLTMTKIRNEVLETSFDKLNELINSTVIPKINLLPIRDHDDTASDVEEVPRPDLHPWGTQDERLLSTNPDSHRDSQLRNSSNNSAISAWGQQPLSSSHRHFSLSQTDVLMQQRQARMDTRLSTLESNFDQLSTNIANLDARSSLALMNETLRIREELAQINGAMYSTRAQIQWLVNRERLMSQRDTMNNMAANRGRPPGQPSMNPTSNTVGESSTNTSSTNPVPQNQPQRPNIDRNMSSAWSTSQSQTQTQTQTQAGPSTSTHSSASTSPMFSASIPRPSLRRASGGSRSSQERVKL